MAEQLIDFRDVNILRQELIILKDINLKIDKGEFIYLIGRVGSGKSSLMKCMYADIPVSGGDAEIFNYNLKKIKRKHIPFLRRKIGIVFQDFQLLTDRTVYANLEFVLKATGWNRKEDIEERIDTVLKRVDMHTKGYKMPHQLSGGEQQRVVIARALLNNPEIILADEPTGNLDPETGIRIVNILKDICASGTTVIMATHNHALTKEFPGRVLCIEGNNIIELNMDETSINDISQYNKGENLIQNSTHSYYQNQNEESSVESNEDTDINSELIAEKEIVEDIQQSFSEVPLGESKDDVDCHESEEETIESRETVLEITNNYDNKGFTLNDMYATKSNNVIVNNVANEIVSEDNLNSGSLSNEDTFNLNDNFDNKRIESDNDNSDTIENIVIEEKEEILNIGESLIKEDSAEIDESLNQNRTEVITEIEENLELFTSLDAEIPVLKDIHQEINDSGYVIIDEEFGYSEMDTEQIIEDINHNK